MNGFEESGLGFVMEYNYYVGVGKFRIGGIGFFFVFERKQVKKKLFCNLKYSGSFCVKVFFLILFINKFNVVLVLFLIGLKYRVLR